MADAWLLALVGVRGRRRWLQAAFAALALTFLVNGAAFVGTAQGLLDPAWESAVLWTLVLEYPLTTILVLSLLHGETVPRRRPAVFLLLVLAPAVVLLTPSADWAVANAYAPNLLGAFLIVCLGVALAEAVYQRMTSDLFAADAFWLAVGVVALIVGGPIYALEFQDLGLLQSAGSNVSAPIALAIFAVVLLHDEPFPGGIPRHASRGAGASTLASRSTVVFDEERPKYALETARRAAAAGEPVLLLAHDRAARTEPTIPTAALVPTRRTAARMLTTAAEFAARASGGLVVVLDLSDVAVISGWPRTREAILRIMGVAGNTGARVALSASRLTPREKEDLRALGMSWWVLPDPAQELEATLAASFGPGARQLLDAFARSEGIRREDLTVAHVVPFLAFLDRAVSELGAAAADAAARPGLQAAAEGAAAALRSFAARDPAELAKGDWPSRASPDTDRGLLVTATQYWQGQEMEELFSLASELGAQGSLFEQARTVFVEQLGAAGEGLLRSELAKLGRRPEDLRPEDVRRLADRAAVDLAAMADVVDVAQEKTRIRGQVESIRRRLVTIAGDDP